ncbi:hypothetical protein SNEBB_000504, partial [Seison nebaliae]
MKKTWQIINKILKPSKNTSASIKLSKDGQTVTDKLRVVNILNDFFVGIGSTISSELPATEPNAYKAYVKLNQHQSFYLSPTNSAEVMSAISSLKNKNGGVHTFNITLIKQISHIIAPHLSKLVNRSFTAGVFPDVLKHAKVTPIFKAGDKTDPNNYRPISCLPLFSKIFERIMNKKLINYFDSCKLLSNNQFGFRQNMSTVDALLNYLDYVYFNLDKVPTNFIISIFLDLRKAFDVVDHEILIGKLEMYGIRGPALNWIQSYLSQRKQCVVINGVSSEYKVIGHGVPQGSIIGPTLFLIYINDIIHASDAFFMSLFADDTSASIAGPDLNILIDEVNNELDKLSMWFIANRMAINVTKTVFMIFGPITAINLSPIMLNNVQLKKVSSVKFLGLHLDDNLSFKEHCVFIGGKLSRSIGILHRLRYILPEEVLKSLYYS